MPLTVANFVIQDKDPARPTKGSFNLYAKIDGVYVQDEKGRVVKIGATTALKGEKGSKGDKGDKGDDGESVTITTSPYEPSDPDVGDIWIVPGTTGTPISSADDDFSGYTIGASLGVQPGWTAKFGGFLVTSGEMVTSNGAGVSILAFRPSGFTPDDNHVTEVVIPVSTASSNAQGAACCIQSDGRCYHAYVDSQGGGQVIVYLGYVDAAGAGSDYVNVGGLTPTSSVKIKMTPSGSGVTRAVTTEIDIGAGYFTPSGWANKDFGVGKRLDGGDGGLAGFSNTGTNKITSISISGSGGTPTTPDEAFIWTGTSWLQMA